MKIKTILLSMILVVCTTRLFSQNHQIDSSKIETIRINPGRAIGSKISDIFSAVQFIPLETIKNGLFGAINNLKIVDNHYIFFDYDTKAVFIFSSSGKFRARIDASKVPGNENVKANLLTYLVDSLDGKKKIGIPAKDKIVYFDLNGAIIASVPIKSSDDYNSVYFSSKRDAFIKLQQHEYIGKDTIYFDLVSVNKGQVSGEYFPYTNDRYKNDMFVGNGSGLYDRGNDSSLFFIKPHTYNIYEITPNALALKYRFVFPSEISLPMDFLSSAAYKNKRIQYLKKNDKIIYGIGNTYLVGENLFFKTNVFEYNNITRDEFILNLKTRSLVSIADMQPDSLSNFLPVTDSGLAFDFKQRGFLLYRDGYFYTSYSSLILMKLKEQNAAKKIEYDKLLKSFFSTGNSRSNPVLIRLKPKVN